MASAKGTRAPRIARLFQFSPKAAGCAGFATHSPVATHSDGMQRIRRRCVTGADRKRLSPSRQRIVAT